MAGNCTKGGKGKAKKKLNGLKRALHGQVVSVDFFSRHWVPVLLVMAFALAYIGSKYICQSRFTEIQKLNKELEIVKAERIRVRAEYMGRTAESSMKELVDTMHLGLHVAEQPPISLDK